MMSMERSALLLLQVKNKVMQQRPRSDSLKNFQPTDWSRLDTGWHHPAGRVTRARLFLISVISHCAVKLRPRKPRDHLRSAKSYKRTYEII